MEILPTEVGEVSKNENGDVLGEFHRNEGTTLNHPIEQLETQQIGDQQCYQIQVACFGLLEAAFVILIYGKVEIGYEGVEKVRGNHTQNDVHEGPLQPFIRIGYGT